LLTVTESILCNVRLYRLREIPHETEKYRTLQRL